MVGQGANWFVLYWYLDGTHQDGFVLRFALPGNSGNRLEVGTIVNGEYQEFNRINYLR